MMKTNFNKEQNDNNKILTKKDLRRVFIGNISNEAVWDNVRGNNLGFAVALIPALKKIYKNQPDKYNEALYRHYNEFFNTSMQPIPFIQGVVLAMEEENSKTDDYDVSTITAIKAALIGPLAGIFDALFLNTLRVIGVALGVNFCMEGNFLGAIIYLLIFNIPSFYCKYVGAGLGYNLGTSAINKLLSSGLMDKFKYAASLVAMMVFGSMTFNYVNLNFVFNVGTGESIQTFQEIIDPMFPGLTKLLLLFGCWWLMFKKKKKFGYLPLMLLSFVLSIVLAYFGILG